MRRLVAEFLKAVAVASLLTMAATTAYADATEPTGDIKGAEDNTLAKRYEGSFIVSYEKFAYSDFRIPLTPLKPSADPEARDKSNNRIFAPEKVIEVEGALTRLVYVQPPDRSPLEVLRNYQDVVEAAKGEVLFECKKEECGGAANRSSSGGGGDMSLMQFFLYESDVKDAAFSNGACALTAGLNDQRFFAAKIPEEGGDAYVTVQTFSLVDDLYCKALNGRTIALVHVLEPKGREKKMVLVEAAEMADALSTAGSISLYGIFFDTDKAVIKPESEPTMKEIAKLLSEEPKMTVIVVGHTDNQGAFDYNIDLSSRRAKAVKTELVKKYGVAGNRLVAAGAGMMAPVASNDEEAGRAKNRRVVLVKAN